MNEIIKKDNDYKKWISEVSRRFKSSQIKAAIKANDEMIRFYWSLGHDMDEKKVTYSWGSHFYAQISADLQKELPDVKSFSPRNLLYMHQFYRLFPITQQLVSQNDIDNEIFMIPWGHIVQIINKCKDDQERALFYIHKTIENNWSRAVLLNFLDTDLYERQGKAITNFSKTLPKIQSDLAQAITKDPYKFDFLTLRERYDEKELKDALMANIEKYLLELGNGFAFCGREVRIDMGETENFMDMLFYNIKLHCYVVVEIKVKEFDAADMGQLGTYMVAVNHQLKTEADAPTLGLLICKSKDNVKAKYALEASSQPMGISEYDINSFLPENYRSSLPTIEEIESELKDDDL